MTIHQPVNADGDRLPGLLALGTFGETVLQELAADGPEVKVGAPSPSFAAPSNLLTSSLSLEQFLTELNVSAKRPKKVKELHSS